MLDHSYCNVHLSKYQQYFDHNSTPIRSFGYCIAYKLKISIRIGIIWIQLDFIPKEIVIIGVI